MKTETITLPLADVRALVQLGWELTRHISETDRSATGSIYGIEYAHKTIAKVAVLIPEANKPDYLGKRFRKVGGFVGVEEYLLWDGNKMWCVFKNVLRAREDFSGIYTLESVERLVARGDWEVFTAAP